MHAAGLSAVLDAANIPAHSIGTVNWKEYPYRPDVKFRIAHDGANILLHYQVDEADIQAVCNHDNGNVWEDSCVEFFVAFDDERYYNIECNCIGRVLVATGAGRQHRIPVSSVLLDKIERWSSLGSQPMENQSGKWELSLIIPKEIFYLNSLETLNGIQAKGNFYKCGDGLKTPHFLSWNAIGNETPDFHLPRWFGEITFDK
ncbi:MAG: hypothetical protein EZS26_000213 [Candidatus Ordinivivax streblomastigis]|uniref:Carbohydrate-binding domain-containing protein n=1 Tax=Candidatus Ordinivivax streblomastigis TaxID=2540710 RepID=A0A5M8P5T0_9BACT|nr:MAG: hypothetical protein EZS26_000213 [Candidatus Ordinivivax streblomastigis]